MQKIFLVFDSYTIEGEHYDDLVGVCSSIEEADKLIAEINAMSKRYKGHRGSLLEVYAGWREQVY